MHKAIQRAEVEQLRNEVNALKQMLQQIYAANNSSKLFNGRVVEAASVDDAKDS